MTDANYFGEKKAIYHTFGCKLNFAETSSIAATLKKHGVNEAKDGEAPDLILINSCSVTELADKKCRQTIRSFNRKYPDAAIIVTGCYAQLKPNEIIKLPGVKIVAGTDKKNIIFDFINNYFADPEIDQVEVTPTASIRSFNPSCSRGNRTRYFLKIQDGCDYFCSYCTIPMARGRSRSADIKSVIEQANQVATEGGREIVITGVNIGDFGKGRDEDFFDLIKRLDEIEGIDRYRISSIEPNLLTDDMIKWVAQSKRFMPHFHIPLQNGNDEVLNLMRRRYDTALFKHKIDLIRTYLPDAFIGVDLIVGARGETLECFESSKEFVDSLDISRLHVFPYSERPGTRAIREIEYIVDQHEKHRRAEIMNEISDKKLHDFYGRFIGTTRRVLVEHKSAGNIMKGFTDNYIKVSLKNDPQLYNKLVDVRISEINNQEMMAEIL